MYSWSILYIDVPICLHKPIPFPSQYKWTKHSLELETRIFSKRCVKVFKEEYGNTHTVVLNEERFQEFDLSAQLLKYFNLSTQNYIFNRILLVGIYLVRVFTTTVKKRRSPKPVRRENFDIVRYLFL